MSRRAVSGMMLTVLLTSMLVSAFNIPHAEGSGTIYIRADGSIDPPTAPIQKDGDYYVLTADINSALIIERNNIVFHGNGFSLQGDAAPSSRGIFISGRSNVTVESTVITSFYYGVYLSGSSNCTVTANSVANNQQYGILVTGSSEDDTISYNTITNSSQGICLVNSVGCVARGNNVSNNTRGITLEWDGQWSKDNYIVDNALAWNTYGIIVDESNPNNIISGNTVTGSTHGIWLWSCADNSILTNNLTGNERGIYLYGSPRNVIAGNNLAQNSYGLYLRRHAVFPDLKSKDNRIYNNNLLYNTAQVYIEDPLMPNYWDDGYPSGGNYWSDYTDIDLHSGLHQNETGSDGIWDHPHVLDANNQDHYPLVGPHAYAPWPQFQHDAQHTGRSPFVGPSKNPQAQILLGNETVNEFFGAPAVGSDGTLYFGRSYGDSCTFHAYYSDGTEKWSYEIDACSSFPVLLESAKKVYVRSNTKLYAINTESGSLSWEKSFDSFYGNPSLSDHGILYFMALCRLPDDSYRSRLIGLGDDGEEVLSHDIGGIIGPSSPTIDAEGTIYYGYNDTLFAIIPNGTERWHRRFEADIKYHPPWIPQVTAPTIGDDGTIYVVVRGESDWQYNWGDGSYDHLHAIDPENPMVDKWEEDYLYNVENQPTIDFEGNIYLTGRRPTSGGWSVNYMYSFTSEGSIRMSLSDGIEIGCHPIIDAENNVYIGNQIIDYEGSLTRYVLPFQEGGRFPFLSLGADGTLYIGGNKNLYAVKSTVPKDVGLNVYVSPKENGPYYIGDTIEFEVSISNPTDTTGINLDAKNVRLTVTEPREIKLEDGWFGITYANIAPGETKSTTFSAEATETGDNVEIKVNANGKTSLGSIEGRGTCYISIHDPFAPKPHWSFAVITDLHIGYGYRIGDWDNDGYSTEIDYGIAGWDDSEPLPQEYNYGVTDRLANAIATIVSEEDERNIKFVVVLGDVSDTAEKSEFFKAREILNRLNDYDIPYIPLFGNHDLWPYTQDLGGPDERSHYASISSYARGDVFFKEVFWGESNHKNMELIRSLFGFSWNYAYNEAVHIQGGLWEACVYDFSIVPDPSGNIYYDKTHKDWISREHDFYLQNYGFVYDGITFVCLDFNPRLGEDRDPGDGDAIPGSVQGGWATSHEQTMDFAREYFRTHVAQKKTAMIFSHHTLSTDTMNNLAVGDYDSVYSFAGHVHVNANDYEYDDSRNFYRFTTEDVAGIEFMMEPLLDWDYVEEHTGERVIRIVEIRDTSSSQINSSSEEIDYSTILKPLRKVDIYWPYPFFTYTHASFPEPNEEIGFTAHFTACHGFTTSFDWDFGDGTFGFGSSIRHYYLEEGEYNVTLTVTKKNLLTDEETNQSVVGPIYVHEKRLISPIPSDLNATSLLTRENLNQVPKNTYQSVLITNSTSGQTPIAEIGVHFEQATDDTNLSGLIADADPEERISLIYMVSWPPEVEYPPGLLIPSSGTGQVYICLNATSLNEVHLEDADLIINVGETINNITVTTTYIDGIEYYLVYGNVTGLGGGEIFHDITVTDVIPSKTVVGQGFSLQINVTVQNSGIFTESFDIVLYADTTAIGTENIVLASRSSTNITFTWNTADYAKGNYTISAYIEPVPGETLTGDNTHMGGIAIVTIPGDVNGDRKVDASDLADLNKAYGSTYGSSNWNPNCDVDGDNKVDVLDLFLQSKNYGRTDL